MNTPSIWTLNFRDLTWLTEEQTRWRAKADAATSLADKRDIFVYLDAVMAERAQRLDQYKTMGGTILGAAAAPFEAIFGTSGGAGVAGLISGATETVKDTAASAGTGIKKELESAGKYTLAALTVLGVAYLYFTKGKK